MPRAAPQKLSQAAFAILISLGLLALAATWHAISNYVMSLESVRNLELELADIRPADSGASQLIVQFRLRNRSDLPIRLNSYFFDLHLDGTRIGGSYSTWRDDPDVDRALYSRASTINQILAPNEELDLSFPLFVFDLDRIMAARPEGSAPPAWSMNAGFRLIDPHGREERLLRLNDTLQ